MFHAFSLNATIKKFNIDSLITGIQITLKQSTHYWCSFSFKIYFVVPVPSHRLRLFQDCQHKTQKVMFTARDSVYTKKKNCKIILIVFLIWFKCLTHLSIYTFNLKNIYIYKKKKKTNRLHAERGFYYYKCPALKYDFYFVLFIDFNINSLKTNMLNVKTVAFLSK